MAANAPLAAHGDVPLDHVIFHAGQALGELASFFERIGFTLTPLGRHSSGSVNRLAILDTTYLELIGFEPGTPPTVRPEVQSLPLGLSGIAAADRPEHRRKSPAERFLPARRLERPVDMPGLHGLAVFTNTELRDPAPDVRVFLCRHHTPELVWHPAWQGHANGASGVRELRLRTRDAPRLQAALRTVFDIEAAPAAQVLDAGGTRMRIAAAGEHASLTLRVRGLDAARLAIASAGIAHRSGPASIAVTLPGPHATDIVFAAP
jgi:hypothetical protein